MAGPTERGNAGEKILEEIIHVLDSSVSSNVKAAAVKDLAEAWAWLYAPAQPHGSSSTSAA
jgi:hypothetical protein